MANAAVVYSNMADTATVVGSSSESTLPAANLLTQHVSERWRSLTNDDYFIVDKGNATVADTIMVRGMTAGSTATARLRLSLADSTVTVGDVLDTGALTSQVTAYYDLDYGAFVYVLPTALAFRYARFDISDPASTYVEAGAVCIGTREAFTYNFSAGASIGWVDRSRRVTSSGGQTLVWVDNNYRRLTLDFSTVTASQRYGVIEAMDRVNGQRKNVLMITNTASTNLARDSIFGLVRDLTPVTTQYVSIFGKQINIDERL